MALLASPSTAQITSNTWAVNYRADAAVDFTSDSTSEVTMSYKIGAGRTAIVSLYASSDCTGTDAITEVGMATASQTTTNWGANFDTIVVAINIDKTKIVASNIWNTTDSSLEFCVEVKLESGGEVITKDLQVLDIEFDFDVAYNAVDPFAATADSANAATTDAANVDDYISACKCAGATGSYYQCNTNALAPDDILQVCISSSSTAVEITQVTSLDLNQGSGAQLMSVMSTTTPGDVESSALSAVTDNTAESLDTFLVETVVPARFFASTDAIVVSGAVQVQFASGRRQLVAFEYDASNGRMLLDSPFDTNNPKDAAHHIQLTVAPPSPQEADANFDFEVGVIMASDDASKFNAADRLGAWVSQLLIGAVLSFAYLW